MCKKSILRMFKKSENMLTQDEPSSVFAWGPCKQKVLPTHNWKVDTLAVVHWCKMMSWTRQERYSISKAPKQKSKPAKNKSSLRPVVATPAMELGIWTQGWLAQVPGVTGEVAQSECTRLGPARH